MNISIYRILHQSLLEKKQDHKMVSALVSIIINCHNGEKYLRESLNSVVNQIYKNWELIFFDNLSTDKSKKILEEFKDRRIKYFKSEKALEKCSDNFISFLDKDDVWTKNRIEQQIKFYDKNKSYDFIFSNCYIYDEEKKRKNYILKKKYLTVRLHKNYSIITKLVC